MFTAKLVTLSIYTSCRRRRWVLPAIACVLWYGLLTSPLQAQSDSEVSPPLTPGDFVSSVNQQTAKPAEVLTGNTPAVAPQTAAQDAKAVTPFDGAQAWKHLQAICNIGPRISTSPGMLKQQQYITKHFKANGGEVLTQEFQIISPFNGNQVALQNLLVRYHPDRKRRLMICCHYDTRPFPDQDKRNPKGRFIGANDGGSGVALLCELGRHLADMDGIWGVDLMFFDGEEFVAARQSPTFLGSTFFARQYAAGNIPWRYEYAVLLDMVADKDLQIYFEKNSLAPGPDRLTRSIWSVAHRLGVREFVPKERHVINDDHLPLNNIAKIPTCDIIDFDFPNPRKGNTYWHTTQDNINNCSQDSLNKVGAVVLAWIREMQTMKPQPGNGNPQKR